MAKKIVTQALIDEAADQLEREGVEPSIIAVQQRIGAGSYTTVKQGLEARRAARAAKPPVDVPDTLAALGAELVQAMWAKADALALVSIQATREEAARAVAQAQAALAQAEGQIAKIEREADEQAQQLAAARAELGQLQGELAEARSAAQVAAARAEELSRQRDDLLAQLAEAQRRTDAAAELEAIRQQLAQQAEVIRQLGERNR